MSELLTTQEAAKWATDYLGRLVTSSNISYLIQYARVKKRPKKHGSVMILKQDLKKYYDKKIIRKQNLWKEKLGNDLNWKLSFDHLREVDTTKHVHRLHPYKGKFIPQLVEYFLDSHTDKFKTKVFFKKGDTVLDPFMGCGTTLIQAAELGLNSLGIDVSKFNCLISKVKSNKHDITKLNQILTNALAEAEQFSNQTFDSRFDVELKQKLSEFNKKYFPNPEFKHQIQSDKMDEKAYAEEKLGIFLKENSEFFRKNGTRDNKKLLNEKEMPGFLAKWFSKRIRQELSFYISLMKKIKQENVKNVMKIIISRTARSCRATTHSDLATLKYPQNGPYYCHKHKKLCTPINSTLKHLKRNTLDTVKRLEEFAAQKKKVNIDIIHDDSRKVDISKTSKKRKIDGVFTSPPYVGQIDYHEQHAYAYELFKIERRDTKEIGPLYKGQGKNAREDYVKGISQVLLNIGRFVKNDGNFFIVANDKYNLYPIIAEKSNLKIINKFKRPVLNRTERDRHPYSEIIFHMKKKIKSV